MFLLVDEIEPRFCVYDPLKLVTAGWYGILEVAMSEAVEVHYEVTLEYIPNAAVFPIEFLKKEGDYMDT